MSSFLIHTIRAVVVVSAVDIVTAKLALEIPRFNTPYNGPLTDTTFPLPEGTLGCGNTGNPPEDLLGECTEPINPDAPDLTGYWREKDTKIVKERIEQCGSRWIDISPPVIHDFLQCTGVLGDGLGVLDYNAAAILQGNICSPIAPYCKFETDELSGEKCINLFAFVPPEIAEQVGIPAGEQKVAFRCLSDDGQSMTFFNAQFGLQVYEKVPKEDEPNCMKCVGGDFDGVEAFGPDEVLPCPVAQRDWTQCKKPMKPTKKPKKPKTKKPKMTMKPKKTMKPKTMKPKEPKTMKPKKTKKPKGTKAPVVATEAPVDTTDAPVDATDAPVDATNAPVDATEAPADATESPVDGTEAPVDPFTGAPADAPTRAPVRADDDK